MKNITFIKIWHAFLKTAFVYAIYHLIRDGLQDILGIHAWFTEIGHFEPDPKKIPRVLHPLYFGGLRQYTTFPIEIFFILTIPRALNSTRFTKLDLLMVAVLLLTTVVYLITVIYAK